MLHHVAPALGGLGTFTGLGLVGGGAPFFALALDLEKPTTACGARPARAHHHRGGQNR